MRMKRIIIIALVAAFAASTAWFLLLEEPRAPVVLIELIDAVGDAEGYTDITGVTVTKEENNLILTLRTNENIPQVALLGGGVVFYDFLIDVDKDDIYDFAVELGVVVDSGNRGILKDNRGRHLGWVSFEHLGPTVKMRVPLTKVGDPKSFSLKVRSYSVAQRITYDKVPDTGWAEILLIS
jgi:hypothetical protein